MDINNCTVLLPDKFDQEDPSYSTPFKFIVRVLLEIAGIETAAAIGFDPRIEYWTLKLSAVKDVPPEETIFDKGIWIWPLPELNETRCALEYSTGFVFKTFTQVYPPGWEIYWYKYE